MTDHSRRMWRGILTLATAFGLLGVASGCSLVGAGGTTPPPEGGLMAADVTVVSDPMGGADVSALSCTFQVSELAGGGTGPVQLNARWIAPCGTHKSETFQFKGGDATFTTTYSESGGYPITKTFWVEITWLDARGSHALRSASAD